MTTSLPQLYPDEIQRWYRWYRGSPDDKLGHDGLLYLAEEAAQRLALIAFSIYETRPEIQSTKVERARGAGEITFSGWVRLLRQCAAALRGTFDLWDENFTSAQHPECARLRAATDLLPALSESRTIRPLVEALPDEVDEQLGWWAAWGVVIDYRNRTLGHPSVSLDAEGFYPAMTPLLAAAIEELVWSPGPRSIFASLRVGRYVDFEGHGRYSVEWTDDGGWPTTQSFEGAGSDTFQRSRQVVVSVDSEGTGRFVATFAEAESPAGGPPTDRKRGLPGGPPSPADPAAVNVPKDQTGEPAEPSSSVSEPSRPLDPPPLDSAPRPSGMEVVAPPTEAAVGPAQIAPGAVAPNQIAPAAFARTYSFDAMVRVPTGEMEMGSGPTARIVEFRRPFLIGTTPITQAQYEAIMEINPSASLGPNQPVDSVSWHDAVRFCNRLSELADLEPSYKVVGRAATPIPDAAGFRLPSECEWEYACRGANVGAASDPESAWTKEDPGGRPHDVATSSPNGLGVFDLLGNVWEWCEDPWCSTFPPPLDGEQTLSRLMRAVRGGSWRDQRSNVTATRRANHHAAAYDDNYGFRIVRSD